MNPAVDPVVRTGDDGGDGSAGAPPRKEPMGCILEYWPQGGGLFRCATHHEASGDATFPAEHEHPALTAPGGTYRASIVARWAVTRFTRDGDHRVVTPWVLDTRDEAIATMRSVLTNNTAEQLAALEYQALAVQPVWCYRNGDPVTAFAPMTDDVWTKDRVPA